MPDVRGTARSDGSPSRERLSRIAAMIRDAERRRGEPPPAAAVQAARLIPLAPAAGPLRAEGIVELAG